VTLSGPTAIQPLRFAYLRDHCPCAMCNDERSKKEALADHGSGAVLPMFKPKARAQSPWPSEITPSKSSIPTATPQASTASIISAPSALPRLRPRIPRPLHDQTFPRRLASRPPHQNLPRVPAGRPENTQQSRRLLVGKRTFAYFLNDHHGDGIVAVTCKALPGDNAALVAAQPDRFYLPAYIGPEAGSRFAWMWAKWIGRVRELVSAAIASSPPSASPPSPSRPPRLLFLCPPELRRAKRVAERDRGVHCNLARFVRLGSMSFRAEGRDASVCVREAHARLEVEESLRIRRGVYSFDVIRAQRGICCFIPRIARVNGDLSQFFSLLSYVDYLFNLAHTVPAASASSTVYTRSTDRCVSRLARIAANSSPESRTAPAESPARLLELDGGGFVPHTNSGPSRWISIIM